MNRWDQRFDIPEYVYGTDPNAFVQSMAWHIPMGKVLSLAEGEGRNAVYLAKLGYSVTAVDSSRVGLEKAKRLAIQNDVDITTVYADLEEFNIEPNSWQGIISVYCHLAKPVRQRLHAACVNGLVSGGAFILEAFSPRQLEFGTGGPPYIELLMNLEDIKTELSGLDLPHAVEMERDVVEGIFHTGHSAVVQILGIKS